jgi:cellobiose phosphorylase
MTHSSALRRSPASAFRMKIAASPDFGLVELRAGSPLRIQLLPGGAVFALRHGPALLNQLLPGPAEDGLFRLLLRWRDARGASGWAPLVGCDHETGAATPSPRFGVPASASALWLREPLPGLHCETRLQLHPALAAWRWQVRVRNSTNTPLALDVLHAQDLGLADEGAVRNNEAYTSHYIDFQPVRDDRLGWTLLARQNQPMAHGRHPWLAFACATGAAEFCTDGWQFFGADHRFTNEPAAVRLPALPSRRLQYEFALAGLQSRQLELAPGASGEVTFLARFVEDHPAASSPADLALLREILSGFPPSTPIRPDETAVPPHRKSEIENPRSVFAAPWLHGDEPTASDLAAWFPGAHRHVEYAAESNAGVQSVATVARPPVSRATTAATGKEAPAEPAERRILSFFCGADTHVVTRAKEATVARPHGHILRSGDARRFDDGHFGLTCYAAGLFAAQAYLGHSSFARLLSVMRNALNVVRGSGQRVFVRRSGERRRADGPPARRRSPLPEWHQLGVPSAFAMTPGDARWIYRFGEDVIEARVSCARETAASCLELRVVAGAPCEFLVTHELVLGAAEFEYAGELEFHADRGWVAALPSPDSLVGRHQPGVCFAIAAAEPEQISALGGDELLYADVGGTAPPNPPRGSYAVLRSVPASRCAVILLGTPDGVAALPAAVARARAAFAEANPPARPPSAPVRLQGADEAVARVDEILPWFAHNAAIHFSAPHGLEQYGGAAWGVRDVCQGSVEWLLASGEFAVVRRILETVFAQQYPDGSWPQWFMFPPYRFIQQPHSHGDICFWPVKALCDYVEASNDAGFLRARPGYTDPQRFTPTGPEETLLAHCDRMLAHIEARFLPGTTLVNYGDGDWDDTLQPADPAMRTRLVSAWTVALAYQIFRQFAEICRRAGEPARADQLDELCTRVRRDFAAQLMPDGVVAGFLVTEAGGSRRPLLHPRDAVTRIRFRLLPMTRAILAGLFTPDEARDHLELIARELLYADGVRLMSEPAAYHGGLERLFKRAETAANVGREIGLQYVHAHLRYAEALAKVGDADGLWRALQVVNPVGLAGLVPHAAPRQGNVYFSSSDADFADRYEAAARWPELRTGRIAVRGGWRLYSSGPGLFLHKVRACLLGVRECFGEIVFDPVLPRTLDGLVAETTLCGRPVELRYRVREGNFAPCSVTVNGAHCAVSRRESNPYRAGGVRIAQTDLLAHLHETDNLIEIAL